jgi:hypothetical protein
MQYLSDIGNNPVHACIACMNTSVLMTGPAITAAIPLLELYLLPLSHYLKKIWILVITVKMEDKKQYNGFSI